MFGQPLFIIQNISYCLLFQVFSPFATQPDAGPHFFLFEKLHSNNKLGASSATTPTVKNPSTHTQKVCSRAIDKLCDLHQNDNTHFDKTVVFSSDEKKGEKKEKKNRNLKYLRVSLVVRPTYFFATV